MTFTMDPASALASADISQQQKIDAVALGTRAKARRRFWTSAVAGPGGAGADELCKSVEVPPSDSGDMAQSLTIRKLQHWEQKFSHGCG
jgi:hypothetical protein